MSLFLFHFQFNIQNINYMKVGEIYQKHVHHLEKTFPFQILFLIFSRKYLEEVENQ